MDFLNDAFSTLSGRVGNILPGVLGALAVLIIGLFLAGVVRRLIRGLLARTTIDERIGANLGSSNINVANIISKLAYYLVVIYLSLIHI